MLRARNTEPSADPSIPASGSRTTCFRHRWGWQQTSLILAALIALQPTRFHMHKTLTPVSSQPTCLPSTCAGSRSERNTNFQVGFGGIKWDKWDSAREKVVRARRVVRAWNIFARSKGRAHLGHVRTLEGSCRREMVSCAHTDDAPPRAHPAHVARSLSPCMTRSWRISRAPCIAPWSGASTGVLFPFVAARQHIGRSMRWRARHSPCCGRGVSLSLLVGVPASHHTLDWEGRAAQRRRHRSAGQELRASSDSNSALSLG